jgi:hypothetical protein
MWSAVPGAILHGPGSSPGQGIAGGSSVLLVGAQ